ncbi:hypothetical protein SAMN05216474_0968 [Lishizhenia tianjinensis]|uniref:Uncharacterized protein n=1 Tax=Lishizhenia tianjinensis TaxID=477690 RepID=A0A1I6YKF1_9FLAO|nr:hypothetical protein [Lishizhenia tianjinensis]SFT50912.1 hypothetical protein SAMN05216474_0968 [Lishizhenia tianjinensis]
MDLKEAQIYFPLKEEEDAHDKWEEILFEHKQFFLTRPAIPKVFRSKLKKIQQQYEAFESITGDSFKAQEISYGEFPFSDVVQECFQQMFRYRGQFKQDVLRCQQVKDISKVIEKWLELELEHAQKWFFEYPEDLDTPIVSKEPDPMILLGALRQWDENEQKSFSLLKKDFEVLPKALKDEMKRLSLLLKLNG